MDEALVWEKAKWNSKYASSLRSKTALVAVGERHCAFCLKFIPNEDVKTCGKCKKRVYCSKNCQTADWSPKGKGQGHKIWCELGCGEEGIDFELAPVPGRDLGLFAKRLIPARFRIIVEQGASLDIPRVHYEPLPESMIRQLKLAPVYDGLRFGGRVCTRISRGNHSCNPNAYYLYNEELKRGILFSERDIEKGEEITTAYIDFVTFGEDLEHEDLDPVFRRYQLRTDLAIICPPNCMCQDQKIINLVKEVGDLCYDIELGSLHASDNCDKDEEWTATVRRLLDCLEKLPTHSVNKILVLLYAYKIAMKRKMLKQAEKYASELHDIGSSIFHPSSEVIVGYKQVMNELGSK